MFSYMYTQILNSFKLSYLKINLTNSASTFLSKLSLTWVLPEAVIK